MRFGRHTPTIAAAIAAIVVAVGASVGAAALASGAETASPAEVAMRAACARWANLDESAAPTHDELRAVVGDTHVHVDRAASGDARFVPSADALAYLEAVLALDAERFAQQDPAKVNEAGATVDRACGLVT